MCNKLSKLLSLSIKAILVGYDDQSKAYKCYNPATKQIFISRDVVLDEGTIGNFLLPSTSQQPSILNILSDDTTANDPPLPSLHDPSQSHQPLDTSHTSLPDITPTSPTLSIPHISPPSSPKIFPFTYQCHRPPTVPSSSNRRPSTRLKSAPYKFTNYHTALTTDTSIDYFSLLANFESDIQLADALSNPDCRLAAMQSEMNAHELNQTWELTPLPPGQRALSACWVLREKSDHTGKSTL